ncbi:MAG: hypothetical protein HYW15_00830 [Candidatus Giovannonibacteria bacterium]|nr:MAG: hypothetical protein HYW15_00830 [Candidatus Giovannonibacteria bacterium]
MSFKANAWRVENYSVAEPFAMLTLGVIAVAIAATILASDLYYRDSRRKLIALFAIWLLGIIMIGGGTTVSWLLFLGASHKQFAFPFWTMIFLLSLLATIASVALAQFDLARSPANGEKKAGADEPLPKEGFVKMKGLWHYRLRHMTP